MHSDSLNQLTPFWNLHKFIHVIWAVVSTLMSNVLILISFHHILPLSTYKLKLNMKVDLRNASHAR